MLVLGWFCLYFGRNILRSSYVNVILSTVLLGKLYGSNWNMSVSIDTQQSPPIKATDADWKPRQPIASKQKKDFMQQSTIYDLVPGLENTMDLVFSATQHSSSLLAIAVSI